MPRNILKDNTLRLSGATPVLTERPPNTFYNNSNDQIPLLVSSTARTTSDILNVITGVTSEIGNIINGVTQEIGNIVFHALLDTFFGGPVLAANEESALQMLTGAMLGGAPQYSVSLDDGRLYSADANTKTVVIDGPDSDLTRVNQESGGILLQSGISKVANVIVVNGNGDDSSVYINTDVIHSDAVINNFLASTDTKVVTKFNINASGFQLGDQVFSGNAVSVAADLTGLSQASISANSNIFYNPTSATSLIAGPIIVSVNQLKTTVPGSQIIIQSFANNGINIAPTSGIYANFNGTTSLNLASGTINVSPYIGVGIYSNNSPIGAFYEAGSLTYDETESIAAMTPRLFNADVAISSDDLLALDTNTDGIIDADDDAFADLRVWVDSNENGIVDTLEFQPLSYAAQTPILINETTLKYTAGNAQSAEAQDVDALEASVQVSDPTNAPTIDFDYYRNTFDQVRASDGHVWLSTEIKVTNDGQYAIGTSGGETISYFFGQIPGNVPNILGGAGNDWLEAYWQDNKLWGFDGNDVVIGGATSSDSLMGGEGNDVVFGGYAPIITFQPALPYSYAGVTTLGNGEHDDDLIFGGDGDDQLFAQVGNDTVSGDEGNDTIYGYTSPFNFELTSWSVPDYKMDLGTYETDDDLLFGGAGNDQIVGGVGNDTISGGDDDDVLIGFYGLDENSVPDLKHTLVGDETDDDLMFGGAGNDRIFGEVGDDTLFGDDGDDIILGFTAFNDPTQTLNAGESDNDLISGGAGDDTILGGTGDDEIYGGVGDDLVFGYSSPNNNGYLIPEGETENDTVWGGEGNDQLQGQQGDDFLLGESGDDLLAGQVGNDTMYGGAGNDVLLGFTGYNEDKQTLTNNETLQETDDDFLYGGAGSDTLLGGLGNDYLDGGAEADHMEGGEGDDIYVVNTINDYVLERENAGTDSVLSSVNYLLNSEVDNLYLLGTGDLNGSGNKLDNKIYGTVGDNILDGITGADTMVGYAGDDTYYVDDEDDVIVEQADEGTDTVNASISWTLGDNQENLVLLSYSIPEQGIVDGNDVLVYGYPKRYELDYSQGDKNLEYQGTCALVAISNVITQGGGAAVSEEEVVDYAIENSLIVTGSSSFDNGGSTPENQHTLLEHFGYENTVQAGVNFEDLATKIKNGQGVLLAVNAGLLWDDVAYFGNGDRNHVITVSGVVYDENNTRIVGFYIADSGRGLVSDMTRYMSYADLFAAANVPNGYYIYTDDALKLWDVNIDGTGNSLDNKIVGTEGDNVIDGGAGADLLVGGAGNDTFIVDNVDDMVFENTDEGTDSVQSSVSFTIVEGIENLTLTGSADLDGTGNSADNEIIGNAGSNTLDGGGGNDTLTGGAGNDTYVVDSVDDVVVENSAEGTDTIQANISYTLSANLENLTLTGDSALSGTGNNLDNVISANGAAGNTLTGGSGSDTYVVQNSADVIVENADEGTDSVQSSVSHTLAANVENLTLTGEDALEGGGNSLDNNIVANDAASTIAGGAGNDAYTIQNAETVIVENSAEGTDSVLSSVSYTLSANVENLTLSGVDNNDGSGNASNNTITGNSANNVLDGGAGSDTLVGGAGNDTYVVDNAGDLVTENASEGTDSIQSSVDFTLASNVENLTLTGSSSISGTGNSLDNVLTDNSGSSTLAGGSGNDAYIISNAASSIVENDGEGTDSVTSSVSYTLGTYVDNLTLTGSSSLSGTGNSQDNYLTGNSGDNTLSGAAGNDTLDGGTGADSMIGGTGNDNYFVDTSSDVVVENASEGTDSVSSSLSLYTLGANVENLALTSSVFSIGVGNSEHNFLTGNGVSNLLIGASGNDTMDGGAGMDQMVGGTGDDLYYVDGSSDIVDESASEGTDTVISGVSYTLGSNLENLTLSGSSDNNAVGNSVANVITGNGGNNSIDGSAGDDTMAGGAGDDTYAVDSSSDVVTENASEGTDTVNSSATWTMSSYVENLNLTGASNLNATGNSSDNYIAGNSGANSLVGGAGNDTLDGGTGIDTMVGGTGDDVYYINVSTDVVTENASEGTDTMISSVTRTLAANVENLTLTGASNLIGVGNTLDNYITGNTGANSLTGSDGNDTLDGGAGADTLVGGLGDDVFYVDNASDIITEAASAGTDTEYSSVTDTAATNVENLTLTGSANINATGNASNNILTGNSGDNVLSGGTGVDTLIGGAGNDTYVVDSTTDTITENSNEGIDTVQSSVTYTLGANLENLTLSGTTTSGTGNELDNYLTGTVTYSNTLIGAAGNDTLDGQSGSDVMIGGTGDDFYFVNPVGDTVTENADEGTDTVSVAATYTLGANVENLVFTSTGAYVGTGNSLNNQMTGNSGANTLNGDTGTDTLIGGVGNDVYIIDDASDVVIEDLNEGTADTVQTGISYTLGDNVEKLTLTGSNSVNGTGNSLDNTLTGNSGNNILDGKEGADSLVGGAGDDIYYVDNAGDVVTEGASAGTDQVYASASFTLGSNVENLTLIGTADIDAKGNTLNNLLIGNSGNNILDASTGSDTLRGGAGDDYYIVDSSTADVITENADEGNDTVQSSVTYTLGANLENLVLGGTTTGGVGNELDNYITGTATYSNTLIGGDGNDTLDGGTGTDSMVGGLGNDVYYVNISTDHVVEAADEGTDLVYSAATYTLADNVENLTLTGGSAINGVGNILNNVITGNTAANSLTGGGGSDTLIGGLGNDTYVVDSVDDVVVESSGEGTDDLIQSSVSYNLALADNVENLTLTGSSAIDGTGNTLDNTITGNTGNNWLFGGAGNDSLTAGAGDDILDGGTGVDTMVGSAGNDSFYVDNVGDVVSEASGAGSDIVYSTINYTLGTYVESLVLIGDGDTTATGNASANFISGNSCNNTINGGGGTDTMLGGLGDDTFVLSAAADIVTEWADAGTDTVQIAASYTLGANVENLTFTSTGAYVGTGNALDNYLTGNSGANTLYGGDGNDTLDGSTGNDSMVGGSGDDTYIVNVATDTVVESASEGTDTVQSAVTYTLGSDVENLTLTGGSAINGTGNSLNNVITGNTAANSLTGAAGNDTLDGGTGSDSLVGGDGNDVYVVDAAGDLITENVSEGTDTVNASVSYTLATNVENLTLTGASAIDGTGNASDNVLTGNSAANSLTGAAGNDSLVGADGNDTLDGGTGNDTMLGGAGNDIFYIDSTTDVITENAAEGTDTVNSSVTYTLGSNLENLTLTGSSGIHGVGNELDNVITGNSGANSLSGGDGNDTLDGGAAVDTLAGGLGDDVYFADSSTDVVTENSDEGTDTVNSSVTYTLGSNLENLTLTGASAIDGTGNSLDNVITGNTGANSLSGADGNDTIDGGAGVDTLVGGVGDDLYYVDQSTDLVTEASAEGTDTVSSVVTYTLSSNVENLTLTGSSNIDGVGNALDNIIIGNDGNNSLSGGDGNDVIDGGIGNDTLVGGIGDDSFYVDSANDIVTESAAEGTDTVYSDVTYTLTSNVENLVLVGESSIDGEGNSLDNSITGNDTDNSLTGAAGNDTLDGGFGNDTLVGGTGDDTYFVDSSSDVVTENGSEGTDLVNSSISWELAADLENLTLTGTAAINGAGNSEDNIITGNDASNILFGDDGNDSIVGGGGYDLLDGGEGNDTMIGGEGNDSYFVDSADDLVTENSDEGTDTVNTTVTYTLGSNVENLTLLGSEDIDGEGNSLDNRILGSAGDNSLLGAAGNDTLNGEEGADTLVGGTGDDIYYVDNDSDETTESADEGTDTVYSAVDWTLAANFENLTLTGRLGYSGTGNSLDNVLTGARGNDTLDGASGNDTLDGGQGDDSLIGGAGDDSFYVDSTGDVVSENTSEGTDTVYSSISYTISANLENLTLTGLEIIDGAGNSSDNVLVGNVNANYLSGAAGNDSIAASDGNDTLDGGTGNDTLLGGIGDDSFIVDSADDVTTENEAEGTDTVYSSLTWTLASNLENLTLQGTSAIDGTGNELDNLIIGNTGANSLVGGDGADTLKGGLGVDTLVGGSGNDTFYVDDASDVTTESAAEGTDTVVSSISWTLGSNLENLVLSGYGATFIDGTGNSLDNTITGDRGDNVLDGAAGNDTLEGGIGNDTLDGGTGNDSMTGGAGDDIYYVDSVNDEVIEANYFDGNDTVISSVSVELGNSYVENLTLSGSSNLYGIGNSWDNVLTGNTGNNLLQDDFGDDTLDGGAGSDTMKGGRGDDVYYWGDVGDAFVEEAGEGNDTIISILAGYSVSLSDAEHVEIENLTLDDSAGGVGATGNSMDNVLTGNIYTNTLTGGAGNDTLDGGSGAATDYLIGGLGDDVYVLSGSLNDDYITENSNEGSDTVMSGYTYTLDSNVENLVLTGSSAIHGTGNSLDNVLTGNSAANSLSGAAGNDTLDGGTGSAIDSLIGGTGDDTYLLNDNVDDSITENSAEGTDTVISVFSYTLGANLENLTLMGTEAIDATGNSQDNVLAGNSASNLLSGAAGNDTYLFGLGGGTDTVLDSSGTADMVLFDDSVNKSVLAFFMDGNDLQFGYIGSSDFVTVQDQAVGGNEIERFEQSNGEYLTDSEVNQVIQDMSTYATDHSIAFTSLSDVQASSELMNIIATSWHA